MRVWIDPDRAAARNLTAGEIVQALRSQNVQVAGGAIGQPPFASGNPAFELPIQVQGRLSDPSQFADVVIKTDPETRAITRVRDVARVELGSQDYGIQGTFSGKRGVALAMLQQPGYNTLAAEEQVLNEMADDPQDSPAGIPSSIPYHRQHKRKV